MQILETLIFSVLAQWDDDLKALHFLVQIWVIDLEDIKPESHERR